ncbi:MAG: phosphoribosylamine--glycine ligase [Salibacteraceae bacterium]
MKKLRVLLLGGGGREHALAWKINQSEWLEQLYVAPGNSGTAQVATNLAFSDGDFGAMKNALIENEVDLVVVGPEAPLVKGLREFIESDKEIDHVRIVGPGAKGARLEGSKSFSKQFMKRHSIPTASFGEFGKDQLSAAFDFLESMNAPFVLKADGLAAGKGVLILDDRERAKVELDLMLRKGKFGTAGEKVVIEEFLNGIELSVFVLTDGKDYVILPEAKDYKRIGEGDSGLNTGGMGSISPVHFAKGDFMQKVEEKIIKPTIKGLQQEDIPYNGFIFIGLMNVGGEPFVIEYNCRLGDPETESIIPRIESDLLKAFWLCVNNKAVDIDLRVTDQTAACLMAVSGGYPEAYEKEKVISGLDSIKDSLVFHAGTASKNGEIVTSGGRVIAITSLAPNLKQALDLSYKSMKQMTFEKINYRKDIGFDLIQSD